MKNFKEYSLLREKSEKIKSEFEYIMDNRENINPTAEAAKIALLYGIAGTVWILFSDGLLNLIISDVGMYKQVQTFKGWFYVVATMAILYCLVKSRILLFKTAIDEIYEGYEELARTYEELVYAEDELRLQLDELKRHKDALFESEQRYELAIEGANDGIWDWNPKNNIYYFSLGLNNSLGYEKGEIGNTLESWEGIIHPSDREEARRAVKEYLASGKGMYENIYRLITKSGKYRWILSRGKAIWDSKGNHVRIAGSHTDITEYKEMEEKLQFLAYNDELAGLANKNMIEIEIKKLIAGQNSDVEDAFAVVYMDVDNFKYVNDTLGHDSGDRLLVYIANILKYQLETGDRAFRIGGDEFAILMGNVSSRKDVSQKLDNLINYLRRPWIMQNHEFFISFSIGVAIYPENGEDMASLLKNADTAMFSVKENGKDGYCFYESSMGEKNERYITMVNSLRRAIELEEFTLCYQPVVDMNTGEIDGVEALIRWNNPQRGFVSPAEFIPLAEGTGQIMAIDEWVLRTAFETKKRWDELGYERIRMSVNISGKSIADADMAGIVKELLNKNGIQPEEIQIEVTETAVMKNMKTAVKNLDSIREIGVGVALDDFGAGWLFVIDIS